MSNKTFLYSPALAELARELRRLVSIGSVSYTDAIEQLKKAIRKELDESAWPISSEDNN